MTTLQIIGELLALWTCLLMLEVGIQFAKWRWVADGRTGRWKPLLAGVATFALTISFITGYFILTPIAADGHMTATVLMAGRAALVVSSILLLAALWSLWHRQHPCRVVQRVTMRLAVYTAVYLAAGAYVLDGTGWPV